MNGTALKNWQSYLGFVKGLTDLLAGNDGRETFSVFPFLTRRQRLVKDSMGISCFSGSRAQGGKRRVGGKGMNGGKSER